MSTIVDKMEITSLDEITTVDETSLSSQWSSEDEEHKENTQSQESEQPSKQGETKRGPEESIKSSKLDSKLDSELYELNELDKFLLNASQNIFIAKDIEAKIYNNALDSNVFCLVSRNFSTLSEADKEMVATVKVLIFNLEMAKQYIVDKVDKKRMNLFLSGFYSCLLVTYQNRFTLERMRDAELKDNPFTKIFVTATVPSFICLQIIALTQAIGMQYELREKDEDDEDDEAPIYIEYLNSTFAEKL